MFPVNTAHSLERVILFYPNVGGGEDNFWEEQHRNVSNTPRECCSTHSQHTYLTEWQMYSTRRAKRKHARCRLSQCIRHAARSEHLCFDTYLCCLCTTWSFFFSLYCVSLFLSLSLSSWCHLYSTIPHVLGHFLHNRKMCYDALRFEWNAVRTISGSLF